MPDNANEQNDLDPTEGLADLNRIALQELPINEKKKKCNECWLTGCVNGPPCCDTFPLERKLIKRFYWKVSILRSEKVFINSYLVRMYAESSVWVIEIE